MSSNEITLIVGLGNPGEKYARTRHNAGFIVADEIADSCSISLSKSKFDVVFGRGRINGNDVIIAKPMAFMNRSGLPIRKLSDYFGIKCEDLIIIYDDIDLPFGRIKIKEKGGHGGHNGIRSLVDTFGSRDFPRLRVGVGRSGNGADVTGHVLGRFSVEEAEILTRMVSESGKAVVSIVCDGLTVAMNNFNCLR